MGERILPLLLHPLAGPSDPTSQGMDGNLPHRGDCSLAGSARQEGGGKLACCMCVCLYRSCSIWLGLWMCRA